MVNRIIRCDPEQLQQLLSGDVATDTVRSIETHLEHCGQCRSQLKQLAADDSFWNETSSFLLLDELDTNESSPSPLGTLPWETQAQTDDENRPSPLERFVLGSLEPTASSPSLGRLGRHEILSIIGQGGMGIVLRALDVELNRHVAVKLLAPQFASNGAARQRFIREAQAAAAVVHPNVLAIHSVNHTDDVPYLVMPLVDGESLQQRIDREGPLEVRDILRIALQTAHGLAAAHAQGLVHRDIKPANILLDGTVDRILLSDFGLARMADDASLTQSGVIAGTPQYMCPEQTRGEPMDHRGDLFSLGSVMYAMCTGRPPFRADSTLGVLRKIDESEPIACSHINANIPRWLAGLIQKLMSKRIENRFQNATELAEMLSACLAHVQQPHLHALPAVTRAISSSISDRPTKKVWALTLAITLSLAFAAFLWHEFGSDRAEQTEDQLPPFVAPLNVTDAAATESIRNTDAQERTDPSEVHSGGLPGEQSEESTITRTLDEIEAEIEMLEDAQFGNLFFESLDEKQRELERD